MKFLVVALCLLFALATARDLTGTIARPQWVYNQGYTYLRQSLMIQTFGEPCALNTNCSPVSNSAVKKHIVTESVGPFRVTGLKPAVDSLRAIFADVKAADSELYNAVSSAGMLCCRKVRGSSRSYSNHAFGAAVDLKLNGVLDRYGDGRLQNGLVDLYPYFHKHGWYWGAGFSYEDGMHFEVSYQKMSEWINAGVFGSTSSDSCSVNGASGTCKQITDCNGSSISGKCPGAWNIQCCIESHATCYANGEKGSCIDYRACSGTTTRGLCPGSSMILCCTGDSRRIGREDEPIATDSIYTSIEEQLIWETARDTEEGPEGEEYEDMEEDENGVLIKREKESSSSVVPFLLGAGAAGILAAGAATFMKRKQHAEPMDYAAVL